jgi:hypothetical protein
MVTSISFFGANRSVCRKSCPAPATAARPPPGRNHRPPNGLNRFKAVYKKTPYMYFSLNTFLETMPDPFKPVHRAYGAQQSVHLSEPGHTLEPHAANLLSELGHTLQTLGCESPVWSWSHFADPRVRISCLSLVTHCKFMLQPINGAGQSVHLMGHVEAPPRSSAASDPDLPALS